MDFYQQAIEEEVFGIVPRRVGGISAANPPGKYTMIRIGQMILDRLYADYGLPVPYYGA